MNARVPAINRLSQKTIEIIEQVAEERAKIKAEEEFAKRESDYLRRILKLVCVHNHHLFGIGAERALRLIQAINEDVIREDEELLWKHTDDYLNQIGLTFYEREANE